MGFFLSLFPLSQICASVAFNCVFQFHSSALWCEMDHFVYVALHSDEQLSWHQPIQQRHPLLRPTHHNSSSHENLNQKWELTECFWLRGRKKIKRQGSNNNSSFISFPHRTGDFQSNLFTNSYEDRKNKPTLALWHPGWCLLRTECSFQRLHCIIAQGSALDRRVGLGAHREYLDIIWENKFSNRPFKEASKLYQPLEQPLFYPA